MFSAIVKSIVASLFLWLFFPPSNSLAQCNDWEKLIAYDNVYVSDIERDRFGNLYAVGWFNAPNFIIDGVSIPLYGDFSVFILKFNRDFSLQWARSAGNNGLDMAYAIELDNEDKPVIAGYFLSTSIQFDCITLYSASRAELFLVKYNTDGDVLWARGTSGLEDGFWADISITRTNSIVLTSTFVTGSVAFDGKSVHGTGGYDSFVASLTASGEVTWMRSFGGADGLEPDYITGIDTDSDENIVVTGFFESEFMVFDDFKIPRQTVSENFFIAKLTRQGDVLWAKGAQAAVDNSGWDIGVDKDDNIYVVGRFVGGDTKFDQTSLPNAGDSDVFVVQYDPDGSVLQGRSFGGPEFDAAQKLAFDNVGAIVVSGYFYSYSLSFDSYTLTKPEFQSDLFVATLNNTLETECIKQVSGAGEGEVNSLVVDRAGNIWLVANNLLDPNEMNFDGIFTSTRHSMIAAAGDNGAFDPSEPGISFFNIDLGPDVDTCPGEPITLDAGEYCNAVYTWNDGSQDHILIADKPGTFWVSVRWRGTTAQDTITIRTPPRLQVDLGDDVEICEHTNFSFNVTQSGSASYEWSDGVTAPVRAVHEPGLYWVKVQGECEAAYDSVSINVKGMPQLDLGKDLVLCGVNSIIIGKEISGAESYLWQDNSTSPTLVISTSGIYEQTVGNECGKVSDEIRVTFVDRGSVIIPNVVTDDGNLRNDKFILPEVLGQDVSLTIFNRWGNAVFSSDHYENNWPDSHLATGIYYYLLKGDCFQQDFHGSVQLLR
ncbi:MAG TPA: gliding motility-associated C-terminal domain-containing protein [Cyclobacteriaceae bacterium]|nr:gliding motility-associated C-terminal domain-containing protein [Cyclobacteriaceae bacterium]